MNKILSIIFFVGFMMTGAQSFITGAYAQCMGSYENCGVVEKKSSKTPEAEEEELPHEVKRLKESIS